MKPITYKLELNHKTNKDGSRTLFLRITQNRKSKRIKLISVEDKYYNLKEATFEKANWVKRSHPAYRELNKIIYDHLVAATGESAGKGATALSVIRSLKGESSTSFIAYAEGVTAELESSHYNTFEQYRTALKKLKEFLNGHDLLFENITTQFLQKYESHLKKLGNGQTTRYNNFKIIRAILYRAMKDRSVISLENPFLAFKFKPGKTHKAKLTDEEISRIEALELDPWSYKGRSRNFYLFCYYVAGMRVRDMMRLTFGQVATARADYQTSKTGKAMIIKLNEKAMAIVEIYKSPTSKPSDYIFPLLENGHDYSDQKVLRIKLRNLLPTINRNLKKIQKLASIDKNLSMHTARHSFTAKAWSKTKNLKAVQQLLGHDKIATTEVYLQDLGLTELDRAMDDIFNPD